MFDVKEELEMDPGRTQNVNCVFFIYYFTHSTAPLFRSLARYSSLLLRQPIFGLKTDVN